MRLIACHVDNFGTLHDFDMTFEDGLNVIMRDNGWGKSTLAAFLKAMLYGYDNKRSKDLSENDRKHYKPWQGGKYGGTLTFEKGGTRYVVSRTFGDTARFDTVSLREADSGRMLPQIENVGEWLFMLDANAFKRSVFINSNQLNSGNSGLSLHARLNAVLGEASDVGAYDAALAQIIKRTKDYEKTGNRGYIAEIQKKIDVFLTQQREAKAAIARVDAMRQRIAALDGQIREADGEIAALKEKLDAEDSGRKERDAARKLYGQMKAQRDGLQGEMAALMEEAGGAIPSMQEILGVKQNRSEIARLTEGLSALKAQKDRERQHIQTQYDALLARETALDADMAALVQDAPIPETAEIQTVRQGRTEMHRLADALAALTAEEQAKRGQLQAQYDALLDAQSALEKVLEEASAGLGAYIPTHADMQEARHHLADIAQIATALEGLARKKADMEQKLRAMTQRWEIEPPTPAELAGILRTQHTLEDAQRRLRDSAPVQEALDNARREKAALDAVFADEQPEMPRLQQISREIAHADALESTAMGLEAQAAGEQAKAEGIEAALRQLEADVRPAPSPAKPKPIAAVAVLAGAVVLAALGAVVSPVLFAGAAALALAGIVLLGVSGKKRAEHERQCQAYAAAQQQAQEKRAGLSSALADAQRSGAEKASQAADMRNEAAQLVHQAVMYLTRWDAAASRENAVRIADALREKLEALHRAEQVITLSETQIKPLHTMADAFQKKLELEMRLLPRDTADIPLAARIAAAEEDVEQLRQMKADLKAICAQIDEQEKKRAKLTGTVSTFLGQCGIPFAGAEQGLRALEERTDAVADAKRRLAEHQRRTADFEAANRAALMPSAADAENSAAGRMKQQLSALETRLMGVLTKYAVAAGSEETWLAESERRLAQKDEIAQRQKALSRQITDFENANRDTLTGKETAEADQGGLEAQLEALSADVDAVISRYTHSGAGIDAWLAEAERHAAGQEDIRQRMAALDRQIAAYEASHQGLLAPQEDEASGDVSRRMQGCVQHRESLLKERTQAEDEISHADETLESYRMLVSRLRLLGEEKQKAQKSLYVLKKSAAYLKAAKENLASRYMGQIEHNFNQYFSAWVKSEDIHGVLDADFNITMDEDGHAHDAEGYSTGYCDMIDFCMRLALIDTLYEEERPFIIMDDPFVNLDAIRLNHAMRLLKTISAESQIIYFVCHEVRASEPTEAQMPELTHQRLVKSAAPKAKAKPADRKARFVLNARDVLQPVSAGRRITNAIFTLGFTAVQPHGGGEYELFFVDENEKVLCDRQQVTLADGEVIPEKVRFCLNTGSAAGTHYALCVRDVSAPENEIVQRIGYESAIVFAADFGF